MTYSLENLVFRAVGCAVNTAAWAANNLLEVMYPREDPAHIWDDSPREGVEAALADPHPVGVDDPAGGRVPPAPPAGSLTWAGWSVPAVLEVLAEHEPRFIEQSGYVDCCQNANGFSTRALPGFEAWREHVAPIIADRIACDPQRAVLALTSLQSQ